jgi:hypothetical protein
MYAFHFVYFHTLYTDHLSYHVDDDLVECAGANRWSIYCARQWHWMEAVIHQPQSAGWGSACLGIRTCIATYPLT